ncbi:MAG: hypothetical protein HRU25_11635 [Psychrobium sp.]|nr:hypothetical protein [Psychrobium sp.]
MLEEKLHQLLELSIKLKAMMSTVDITADNEDVLSQAVELVQQRDKTVRELFNAYSAEQLTEFSTLLNEFVEHDEELQTISLAIKTNMSKQIVKQKRNTKAAKAYLNK